jgi:hypothetical protein
MCGGFGFDNNFDNFDGCCGIDEIDIVKAQLNMLQDRVDSTIATVLGLTDTAMFTTNAYEVGASCLNGQVIFLPGETTSTGDYLQDALRNNLDYVLN